MDKNPSLLSGSYAIVVDKSDCIKTNITPEGILTLRPDGGTSISLYEGGRVFECDVEVIPGSTIDTFTLRLRQRSGDQRVVTLSRRTAGVIFHHSTAHTWKHGVRPVVHFSELLQVLEHLVTRR
jgi:hypothetical protein